VWTIIAPSDRLQFCCSAPSFHRSVLDDVRGRRLHIKCTHCAHIIYSEYVLPVVGPNSCPNSPTIGIIYIVLYLYYRTERTPLWIVDHYQVWIPGTKGIGPTRSSTLEKHFYSAVLLGAPLQKMNPKFYSYRVRLHRSCIILLVLDLCNYIVTRKKQAVIILDAWETNGFNKTVVLLSLKRVVDSFSPPARIEGANKLQYSIYLTILFRTSKKAHRQHFDNRTVGGKPHC